MQMFIELGCKYTSVQIQWHWLFLNGDARQLNILHVFWRTMDDGTTIFIDVEPKCTTMHRGSSILDAKPTIVQHFLSSLNECVTVPWFFIILDWTCMTVQHSHQLLVRTPIAFNRLLWFNDLQVTSSEPCRFPWFQNIWKRSCSRGPPIMIFRCSRRFPESDDPTTWSTSAALHLLSTCQRSRSRES